MRPYPEPLKRTLWHLAAARFLLPVQLEEGEYLGTESRYDEYLHQTESTPFQRAAASAVSRMIVAVWIATAREIGSVSVTTTTSSAGTT